MTVKTSPAYKLLAAFEADKRSFPGMGPRVLLQMTAFLEHCGAVIAVILPLLQFRFGRVVHGIESGSVLKQPLVGDDQRLLQLDVREVVHVLFAGLVVLVHCLPVIVESTRGQESFTTLFTGKGILVLLQVNLVSSMAVENFSTLVARRLLPLAEMLMDFQVGEQSAFDGESS